MLSDNARQAIREQMARYPVSRSALGHALYIAQEECGGHVPPEAVRDVAEVMGLDPADVQSMMSFYVMYNKEPIGKFLVEICHNISCAVMGCRSLLEVMERECGIGPGDTSADGLFTLKSVECSAACGGAPAVQINGLFHEKCTPEQLRRLLEQCRSEGQPRENLYNAVYTPERTPRAAS